MSGLPLNPSERARGRFKNEDIMTEKDKRFIAQAEQMGGADWMQVSDMEDNAESPEARIQLGIIRKKLYHMEECAAGVL